MSKEIPLSAVDSTPRQDVALGLILPTDRRIAIIVPTLNAKDRNVQYAVDACSTMVYMFNNNVGEGARELAAEVMMNVYAPEEVVVFDSYKPAAQD